MTSRYLRRSRHGALTALALSAVTGLTLTGLPQGVALTAKTDTGDKAGTASPVRSSSHERKDDYDARQGSLKTQLRQARSLVSDRGRAFDKLAKSLGSQAVVDFDPLTGTPRNLSRLDGFLTGPSSAPATEVAMRYVRAHLAALGLTKADLATFTLRQDYVDVAGIHHIAWTQSARGVPLFGNGLKANVTKSGQLLSLQGSPVSGLASASQHLSTAPALSPSAARTTAALDVGGKATPAKMTADKSGREASWSNNDQAGLVWFATSTGVRLGWSTYVTAGDTLSYQHVIDAKSGKVLYRHDTVDFDRGDALVYDNYPGAPAGGKAKVISLFKKGYLNHKADDLSGRYTIAWSDVNDNNEADKGERVPVPGSRNGKPGYELTPFKHASSLCSKHYVCTWNPDKRDSWKTNRRADVTQGFYYDSMYHDYLEAKPFGFTAKAGNFETAGGDPVLLNSLDGADTANGLPDANHIDNANMNTPPDGVPPTMQMYLFHYPGTTDEQEPYLPTSSSYDPSVIFHEYTHGLSNRLVVDASGNSTLNSLQAGAMGEAWSDYYAMDLLVKRGLEPDTKKSGEVFEGAYLLADKSPFRTMAIDCAVGSAAPGCVAPVVADDGGYTYGDIALIGGSPEVHSSGEVWSQTLWDIRKRLGHKVTGMLVTRAMSLSANDPSMLDERNAIIQADLAVYGGDHRAELWRIFAHRGMGFFAGTLGAGDAYPAEDFSVPPTPDTPRSTVSGQVVDPLTGDPVANALVTITGHDSGYVGDYSDVTDASGRYSIPDVFIGRYPLVAVYGPGYEVITQPLRVRRGGTNADFSPRRDWAASSGGANISDFNGPDFSPQCGPSGAIDLSQGSGWGSTTGDNAGTPTNVFVPKFIEVKLPVAITLDSFAVNPSNTCGDAGSASTGDYSIDVSPNGNTWTTAVSGTFTVDDRRLVDVPIANPIPNVRYVRFNIEGNQTPDFATNCPEGNFSGCSYTDMTELEVFGTS